MKSTPTLRNSTYPTGLPWRIQRFLFDTAVETNLRATIGKLSRRQESFPFSAMVSDGIPPAGVALLVWLCESFDDQLVTLAENTTATSLRDTRHARAVALRAYGIQLRLLDGVSHKTAEVDRSRARADDAAARAEAEVDASEAVEGTAEDAFRTLAVTAITAVTLR